MTLQSRVQKYLVRGFPRAEAELLVLIEETAAALFSAFPKRFVLFGGATLVLFYNSPRLSRDLDLLANPEDLPKAEQVEEVVQRSTQPVAETFGLGKLEFEHDVNTADLIKIWIRAGQQRLFSIDLTKIGGNVLRTHIIEEKIGGAPERTVLIPTAHHLLLQKCETFLDRRYVKVRDAFDIHVLLARGAHLDDTLKAHLHDFIEMRELESEQLRERIDRVNTKLCTVELRTVLPSDLFDELEREAFRRLRGALESVFADWL